MKVALITDTHFGARNDSMIFHEYFQRFYDKIFFPYLEEHGIKQIVHLGDIVDRRKYINFNILHKTRTDFLDRLYEGRYQMDLTIGNHDTFFKNTSEVNAATELLKHYPNVRIFTEPQEVEYFGLKILMLPWINDGNRDQAMQAVSNTQASVVMGHLEINGFMIGGGVRCEHGLDRALFDRFHFVFSGHFHHKSDDGTVFYLGTPYEMTFADTNDPRGFHVFDTETRELTFIQNPFKMFHRYYYDDINNDPNEIVLQDLSRFAGAYVKVIVSYKGNPFFFDKFIDKLYQVQPADVSIIDEINYEPEDGHIEMGEDTLTILSKCVDDLGVDVDKGTIKDIMRTLYVEANALESNL